MAPLSVAVLAAGVLLAQAKKVDLPMPPPPPGAAKQAPKAPAPKAEAVPVAAGIKLAMPGLSYAGVDANLGEFFAEYFAQKLTENGIRVTSQKEISSLLGLERQRQMLGCGEQAQSCIAELAGALGVDGVILGSVAKLGKGFAVNLKVISAQDGRVLVAASDRFRNDKRVLDWLAQLAPPFAARLGFELRDARVSSKEMQIPKAAQDGPDDDLEVPKPVEPRAYAWIPFVSAGLMAAGGGGSYALARMKESELRAGLGATNEFELTGAIGQMKTFETLGIGLGIGAVVSAGVGAGLLMFGGPPAAPKVAWVPTPGGWAVVVEGVLP